MNETKRNERESYETPVVLDIKPVTVTCGQAESITTEDPDLS